MFGCGAALKADNPPADAPYVGHPLTLTIMLDSNLDQIEEAYTIVGFEQWADALGPKNLVLRFGRIDHNSMLASAAPPGFIYVVRRQTREEVVTDCRHKPGSLTIGCWDAEPHRILLAEGIAVGNERADIAAHELGHAMGLGHCNEFNGHVVKEEDKAPTCKKSIMYPTTDKMIGPSATDVREFCRLNGCAPK